MSLAGSKELGSFPVLLEVRAVPGFTYLLLQLVDDNHLILWPGDQLLGSCVASAGLCLTLPPTNQNQLESLKPRLRPLQLKEWL